MPTETPQQGAGVANGTGSLAPTPIDQWRRATKKSEGFVVTLPSGYNLLMKRTTDLITMLRENHIPNPIAAIVAESINTTGQVDFMAKSKEDPRLIYELVNFVDSIVCSVALEPMFTQKPRPPRHAEGDVDDTPEFLAAVEKWQEELAVWEVPDGYLCVEDDLTFDDRMYIFRVALGGAADLELFRKQSAEIMAATSDGADVQLPAEQPPRIDGRPLPGVVSR